jgi:hypothetical protein
MRSPKYKTDIILRLVTKKAHHEKARNDRAEAVVNTALDTPGACRGFSGTAIVRRVTDRVGPPMRLDAADRLTHVAK